MSETEPTAADVLAWLDEDETRGVIDAVRHWWGMPDAQYDEVRTLYSRVYNWTRRRGGKAPHKPTVSRRPRNVKAAKPPQLPAPTPAPVTVYGTELEELEAEIAKAEDVRSRMETDHSWTPYTAHSRYIRDLREQRRTLAERLATDWDPYDAEQVVSALLKLPQRIWTDPRVIAHMAQVLDVIDASDS